MNRRLLAILQDCQGQNISLSVNGDGLEVRGSSTPELREELRRHKHNILTYLRTSLCHHVLQPEECALCSGRVQQYLQRRLT